MAKAAGQNNDVWSFGPFTLVTSERLLVKDGIPVELGARALDMLIALISTPNELVSKQDLMARVWPDVIVGEVSLRFHMASLRKALGDGKDGARYITTLAGRGYCFVAPVTRRRSAPEVALIAPANFPHANLPSRLSRMVGREDNVAELSAELITRRFVTIVGSGGVGKTTVAIAVAHQLSHSFAGAVLFVDLGMLTDPKLASTAVASMLGQSIQSEDAALSLIAFLKGRRILLILDNCEHLLDAVTPLAGRIIEAAPQVHILATSREALMVGGEHVYRLDALACPPDVPELTAAHILEFPATKLFVERAMASGARLDLSNSEARIVVDICRKLDGVALAIELAARRVDSHGLQQTAALLDQRLAWLWQGSRTAPPRQKTLQATLDWSYRLLSEHERVVLRRLAFFVGYFTFDAALDVLSSEPLDRSIVFGAIDSLVAKSMLARHPIGAMALYRLLDTTRAYALDIRMDAAEAAGLAVRHATYYRRWLEQSGTEWATLTTGVERAPYFAGLNNVRAALEWCFGKNGNVAVGVELAAAATPVFLAMSLLPECRAWSERALLSLDEEHRGGSEEMQLQASLGLSLMYSSGHGEATHAALHRAVDIAKARGDHLNEVRLLGPLFFYNLRSGEFRVGLEYAKRCSEIASTLGEAAARALAHTLIGISLAIMGDLRRARAELDAALEAGACSNWTIYFGFDHYRWERLARIIILCQQGYRDQARAIMKEAFRNAEGTHHPVSLAILINSAEALLWIGDLSAAEEHLDLVISRAQSESFEPYLHVGHALKGELAICRGEVEVGVELLKSRLERLHAARYELFTVRLQIVLARGLAASGQWMEAWTLVGETERLIEEKGHTSYLPELLRLKGSILLAMPKHRVEDAEKCFLESLELSRAQGAGAWELRTATDLAAHWGGQGRAEDARALLRPVIEQFTEGLDTPDLKAAQLLLTSLDSCGGVPPID